MYFLPQPRNCRVSGRPGSLQGRTLWGTMVWTLGALAAFCTRTDAHEHTSPSVLMVTSVLTRWGAPVPAPRSHPGCLAFCAVPSSLCVALPHPAWAPKPHLGCALAQMPSPCHLGSGTSCRACHSLPCPLHPGSHLVVSHVQQLALGVTWGLAGTVLMFLWCKSCHPGQFEATNVTSLDRVGKRQAAATFYIGVPHVATTDTCVLCKV